MRFHPLLLPLLALGAALTAPPADAQTLRGSRATVTRTYRQAHAHDLTFFNNPASVRSAANRGELVRLRGDANYRTHQVNYPYALPTTATFVTRLAEQYRAKCGEKMVVTSAVRPRSFRLANSVDESVHPAGMAVDIRKPRKSRCAAWLRETLLYLEGRGVVDATEERRPPHFHVAVFPNPYLRYLGRSPSSEPAVASGKEGPSKVRAAARAGGGGQRTHKVRRGETLWEIARRHGTSVERLKEENEIRSSRIMAGQVLRIPSDR